MPPLFLDQQQASGEQFPLWWSSSVGGANSRKLHSHWCWQTGRICRITAAVGVLQLYLRGSDLVSVFPAEMSRDHPRMLRRRAQSPHWRAQDQWLQRLLEECSETWNVVKTVQGKQEANCSADTEGCSTSWKYTESNNWGAGSCDWLAASTGGWAEP